MEPSQSTYNDKFPFSSGVSFHNTNISVGFRIIRYCETGEKEKK